MSLQSLVMEDLQREPNSKHRYMMMSNVKPSEQQTNVDFISTSCPDVSNNLVCNTVSDCGKFHSSLPDYLEMETIFGGFVRKSRSCFSMLLRIFFFCFNMFLYIIFLIYLPSNRSTL